MIGKVERYFYLTFRYPWPGCERAEVEVAILKSYKGRKVYQLELPTNRGYSLTRAGWRVHKRLATTTLWRKRRAKGGLI